MNIKLLYASDVAVVPASAVAVLERASAVDLRILLALCADAAAREDVEAHADVLCARTGCTHAQLGAALAFWHGAGVLETVGEMATASNADPASTAVPAESVSTDVSQPTAVLSDLQEEITEGGRVRVVRARRTTALPQYTTEELTAMLEKHRDAAAVIHECQNIMRTVFNESETKILVGLMDYLALDGAYLILLCSHCMKLGKDSMRYVERVAFDMVEDGVKDVSALQETLRHEDEVRETEYKIRSLYGAQGRKLTPTEKKYIKRWLEEWRFDFALIERAYETAVDTKGEASMRYADGILKRWHDEGLATIGQVEESDEKWRRAQESARAAKGEPRRGGKASKPEDGGSFDTEDFFEAALKRSFEDF